MTNILNKIQLFIILMLENRSFDHLFGYLNEKDSRIEGLKGNEFNYEEPGNQTSKKVTVSRAQNYVMPFDPGHEFEDVELQLYGEVKPTNTNQPALMNGFVKSASKAGNKANPLMGGDLVMQCFNPFADDKSSISVPVISTLAMEYSIFNYWFSSLPGPTWPNRFFVHAATSGGYTDSPNILRTLEGFKFNNETIFNKLENAGKNWRIYHDGLPQAAGIDSIRLEYINPFTERFRGMDSFVEDLARGDLPEYTFIEPGYDSGNSFRNGNSMHPLNDIRKGELLIKKVYESLRKSVYWDKMMLVITFDEHGGFYDHVPPPETVPTGDDKRYSNKEHPFEFNRLGVRVPAMVISAYTKKGTVIDKAEDNKPHIFDHTSILATVEKRFGIESLTERDKAANTLEVTLNQDSPRLSEDDAILTLPDPMKDSAIRRAINFVKGKYVSVTDKTLMTNNQRSFLGLAHVCEKEIETTGKAVDTEKITSIEINRKAAKYIKKVEKKVNKRRKAI